MSVTAFWIVMGVSVIQLGALLVLLNAHIRGKRVKREVSQIDIGARRVAYGEKNASPTMMAMLTCIEAIEQIVDNVAIVMVVCGIEESREGKSLAGDLRVASSGLPPAVASQILQRAVVTISQAEARTDGETEH